MKKSICIWCGRGHKKPPNVCKAKGEIVYWYLLQGVAMWQIFAAVRCGTLDLDSQAARLIQAKRSRPPQDKKSRGRQGPRA